MDYDPEQANQWLSQPIEALPREIAVGFDNKDGEPLAPTPGKDWRSIFHIDNIQGYVTKHASYPFEVAVGWFKSAVAEHPVIVVEGGVTTPVAVKAPLLNSGGKPVLPMDTVYVRTLVANNTPSSAPESHRDWDDIMRVCFDNREADIGRFFRRQLSSASLPAVLAAFGAPQPDLSLRSRALALLDDGERRFQEKYAAAGIKEGHENAIEWGYNAVVALPYT